MSSCVAVVTRAKKDELTEEAKAVEEAEPADE